MIDERDLKIDTYSNSVSKVVRVTHLPTRLSASAFNKWTAIARLEKMVKARETNRSIND